eukprot:769943-Prymnesium_polylepis.2
MRWRVLQGGARVQPADCAAAAPAGPRDRLCAGSDPHLRRARVSGLSAARPLRVPRLWCGRRIGVGRPRVDWRERLGAPPRDAPLARVCGHRHRTGAQAARRRHAAHPVPRHRRGADDRGLRSVDRRDERQLATNGGASCLRGREREACQDRPSCTAARLVGTSRDESLRGRGGPLMAGWPRPLCGWRGSDRLSRGTRWVGGLSRLRNGLCRGLVRSPATLRCARMGVLFSAGGVRDERPRRRAATLDPMVERAP